MADDKNKGQFDSPDDFDFDATVQLNIGKEGNIVSTAASKEITPDDFERTIDGILGINEAIENMPEESQKTVTLSNEEIDFDELDTGINALASDTLGKSAAPETKENEFLTTQKQEKSYKGLPLLGSEEGGEPDLSDTAGHEKTPPVIELTEEMLDENIGNGETTDNGEPIAEIPSLATSERHVLSNATSAIREISDEDDLGNDIPLPPAMQPQAASGGSGVFPVLLALLGIAAGGYGAWMAYDASNRIDELRFQIQTMSPSSMAKRNREIADIQQRLTKIERRLTGTPTVEAAAPLMSSDSEAATGEKGTAKAPSSKAAAPKPPAAKKPVAKAITPHSEIDATRNAPKATEQLSKGDWVINLSSHTTKSEALREQERLRKTGLNAEIHTARVKERTWYRIQITGFATKGEAKTQLDDVKKRSGVKDAWIGKK